MCDQKFDVAIAEEKYNEFPEKHNILDQSASRVFQQLLLQPV